MTKLILNKLHNLRSRVWKGTFSLFKKFVEFLMPVFGMELKPFYGKEDFPWLQVLEDNYENIREEMLAVYNRDLIPRVKDVNKNVSVYLEDNNWKTFMFCLYGHRIEKNFALCPFTEQVLQQIPGFHTAFFSILDAGKSIEEHRGVYRGNTLAHLGLVIPEPADKCIFCVNDTVRNWEEGKAFAFEDSFRHYAANHTASFRAVLIIEFKRQVPSILEPFDRYIQHTLSNSYITESVVKNVRDHRDKLPAA